MLGSPTMGLGPWKILQREPRSEGRGWFIRRGERGLWPRGLLVRPLSKAQRAWELCSWRQGMEQGLSWGWSPGEAPVSSQGCREVLEVTPLPVLGEAPSVLLALCVTPGP